LLAVARAVHVIGLQTTGSNILRCKEEFLALLQLIHLQFIKQSEWQIALTFSFPCY
jgi:hypothetical protein